MTTTRNSIFVAAMGFMVGACAMSPPSESSGDDAVDAVADVAHDATALDVHTQDASVADANVDDVEVDDAEIFDAPTVDVGIVCGKKFGIAGLSPDGGCGRGERYVCGSDTYQVFCDCPKATCSCSITLSDGGLEDAGSVSFTECPICPADAGAVSAVVAAAAFACGIPY